MTNRTISGGIWISGANTKVRVLNCTINGYITRSLAVKKTKRDNAYSHTALTFAFVLQFEILRDKGVRSRPARCYIGINRNRTLKFTHSRLPSYFTTCTHSHR